MKRLTVNETWEQCLDMWKWISLCIGRKTKKSLGDLKEEWLQKNGLSKSTIQDNCFFCDLAKRIDDRSGKGWFYPSCVSCPGKKVDEYFQCENLQYHFFENPLAFYAKLKRLNKIRLSKKG
jgi:hypothetical protein